METLAIPKWAFEAVTQEARRRGVTVAELLNMWVVDRLDQIKGDKG